MDRYINAGSLLTKIKAYRPYMYLGEDALSYAIKMVELEPSADVRENIRGEWIQNFDGDEWYWFCSNCKEKWYEEDLWMGGNDFPNYCPNCGADMRSKSC